LSITDHALLERVTGGENMRARTLVAVLLAVALAWPALAQEQRGVIEGTVKDPSGAVLPGATVEARAASGAVVSTVSDEMGVFRFPSVAPGTYTVSANLSGFRPQTIENVQVGLGQIKKVDFTLVLAGVTETVQVTSEAPLVDVRQSARQVNIRDEQVELLPKGRDFTTLVTQAPGANNEAKLGGISIDGASAGENRFIIDGIETTDMESGTSGMNLIADFIEEVQVKSSGYTAEYGGATGGVINARSKGAGGRRCASTSPTPMSPSTSRIPKTRSAASSPALPWAAPSSSIAPGSSARTNRP
jgi:hypothetical protein